MNPGGKQRAHKYGAKKTKVDGIWFDSRAEAEYYIHLKDRMHLGQIAGFGRQVEFILQDGDGTVIRYKADFVVWERLGHLTHYFKAEVHEVKGHETPEWLLKEKLFRVRFPDIKLIVVK